MKGTKISSLSALQIYLIFLPYLQAELLLTLIGALYAKYSKQQSPQCKQKRETEISDTRGKTCTVGTQDEGSPLKGLYVIFLCVVFFLRLGFLVPYW